MTSKMNSSSTNNSKKGTRSYSYYHYTRSHAHSTCGSTKSAHNLSDTISDEIIRDIVMRSLPYTSDSEEERDMPEATSDGEELDKLLETLTDLKKIANYKNEEEEKEDKENEQSK